MSNPKPRLALALLATLAALTAAAVALAPRVILNETASLPLGLYWMGEATLSPGELVAFPVPVDVARLVVERHYLRPGAVLVKPIAARAGDVVCTREGVLTVNGKRQGDVHQVDSAGRPLPRFDFCGPVPEGYFLPASTVPLSFDGRYFGLVPLAQVRGRVRPLWTF